jgi:hypothetical protein
MRKLRGGTISVNINLSEAKPVEKKSQKGIAKSKIFYFNCFKKRLLNCVKRKPTVRNAVKIKVIEM